VPVKAAIVPDAKPSLNSTVAEPDGVSVGVALTVDGRMGVGVSVTVGGGVGVDWGVAVRGGVGINVGVDVRDWSAKLARWEGDPAMDDDPSDIQSPTAEATVAIEGAPPEGAESRRLRLAELHRRVASLEAEHARLLERYLSELEVENNRLRTGSPPAVRYEPEAEQESVQLSPPYVARASRRSRIISPTWSVTLRSAMNSRRRTRK
jgi:hypothetical protein